MKSELNFQSMTRAQLRAYLLENRQDQEALQIYVSKLSTEPVLATESAEETERLVQLIEEKRKHNPI